MKIYATRGNVEYTITEDYIKHYESLGFQISRKQDTPKMDNEVASETPTKRQYTKKSVNKEVEPQIVTE